MKWSQCVVPLLFVLMFGVNLTSVRELSCCRVWSGLLETGELLCCQVRSCVVVECGQMSVAP